MCAAIRERHDDVSIFINHHRRNADAVLTVCAVCAVFAIGSILTVGAGIPFVAFFAFLAGRLYAEGSPALTTVIGDIPNVIVADF